MIHMINSFEFQETNVNVSSSLKTNYKPKSRKLEKTIPIIQIAMEKLDQCLLFACPWK